MGYHLDVAAAAGAPHNPGTSSHPTKMTSIKLLAWALVCLSMQAMLAAATPDFGSRRLLATRTVLSSSAVQSSGRTTAGPPSDCSGPYLGVVRYCGATCCCELWQSGITCQPRWFAQVNQVVTVIDENYACCCTKTPGAGFTGHYNGVAPCTRRSGPVGTIAIRAAKGLSTLAPDGRVYSRQGGRYNTYNTGNVGSGRRESVTDSGGPN